MDTNLDFPSFDIIFRSLNDFILKLVDDYHAKKIKSWDDLEAKVRVFFTKAQMDEMESMIPGWKKMSSYSDGITLTHIMCVFLGLFIMSEFQALTRAQQQLAKWIVLFHDTDKMHIKDKKDNLHAFRSAVLTATTLPRLGFLITPMYQTLINSWSQLTKYSATKDANNSETLIQDNSSLPKIVSGIDNLFGDETPSALITKTVLFHMSINVVHDWPQAAPLLPNEIAKYISPELLPLLKVMMLADNEGWSLFHPEERARQRDETLKVFAIIESNKAKGSI